MSSNKKLTNEQVLGRLAASWEDVKNPKHWAHEGSWTNATLRTLGQLNKLAGAGSGAYLLKKVVVNRRGRLAMSGGVALGTTAVALGAHSWEVIKDTFKRTMGTVPSFIKSSAVHDLGLGVAYALNQTHAPAVTPRYDDMRNTYESLRLEAASRGILPPDYALPLENAFQEHSTIQQSLAALTTAAAVTLIQAGKAGPHRGWHGKYAISKAIGVSMQEIQDLYLDMKDSYLRRVGRGGFHEGPHHENEEFAPEPTQYDAPAVPYQGHVDHVGANALGRAEAAAREYAIMMAEHYANQIAGGVAPANVASN